MSEGLTQDDFRKLMATPRRTAEGEEHTFKAPAPRAPRNAGSAVFAQPRAMRKKNFKKKQEEEDEEEKEKTNYRDRAAERRRQELEGTADSTTEELLKITQIEQDQELDPKQLYEQSKFLGGDVDHTHLVKGLDFALLKKVRTDLTKQQEEVAQEKEEEEEEAMDEDLDQVFDKFERGEKIADDPVVEAPKQFYSLMAKNIFEMIEQTPPRNELFEPGRMAYVFELADEVGHYSDAFAIPTAVIRSKADVAAKLARSGWSEDTQADANLVIEGISRVMTGVRRGERRPQTTVEVKKNVVTSEPIAMVEDGFMGDIFADAGRDYELDESTVTSATTAATKTGSYFTGLIDEKEEDVEMQENEDAVKALLSKATGNDEENSEAKRRKHNHPPAEMDADAADIDMFGLSSSALPTSFSEHQTTAYQSDDEENPTQMIDQGTNRNKKAQMTRWDFETEEEWQNYKDTIEIHPKSAFQFGVKLGDGRKRHRERKGMNEKQKLDREYQQVKNIMTQKYGKSLDK